MNANLARFRRFVAISLISSAVSLGTVSASVLFIGGAASEGQNVTNAGSAFTLDTLTLVNLAALDANGLISSPVAFNVTAGDIILPETVNFFAEMAGDVTPFIAFVNDATATQSGASFTLLSIGDTIAGVTGLNNAVFEVGGAAAPSFTVANTGQIVAGFLSEGPSVIANGGTSGLVDLIGNGDGLTAQSVGDNLGINGSFGGSNFDQASAFNIGFRVIPEPVGITLLGIGIVGVILHRRRRQ